MDTLIEQINYVNSLDQSTIEMLKWYTTKEYKELNKTLREGGFLTALHHSMVRKIDEAFLNAPSLKEPLQVYRGIDDEFVADILSYISTSYSITVAEDFTSETECCLLKILILPGSKVLPLKSLSLAKYEDEILLPREGSFIINYVDSSVKPKTYDLTYIPPGSITFKEDKPLSTSFEERTFTNEELLQRLLNLITPEELTILGPEDTIYSLIHDMGIDVPQEVINEAIRRIS